MPEDASAVSANMLYKARPAGKANHREQPSSTGHTTCFRTVRSDLKKAVTQPRHLNLGDSKGGQKKKKKGSHPGRPALQIISDNPDSKEPHPGKKVRVEIILLHPPQKPSRPFVNGWNISCSMEKFFEGTGAAPGDGQ